MKFAVAGWNAGMIAKIVIFGKTGRRNLLVRERSDLNLKEKTTNKNCPYCRYNNITAFAVKYNTSNRPVEEYIPVNFCPKCGANLISTEYINDRLTY